MQNEAAIKTWIASLEKRLANKEAALQKIAQQSDIQVMQPDAGIRLRNIAKAACSRSASDISGHTMLWNWFGGSYASFLTLPRVCMHRMPDRWEGEMCMLLEEYDAMFKNFNDIEFQVRASKNGKLVKMPDWLMSYKYPDHKKVKEATNDG